MWCVLRNWRFGERTGKKEGDSKKKRSLQTDWKDERGKSCLTLFHEFGMMMPVQCREWGSEDKEVGVLQPRVPLGHKLGPQRDIS